MKINVYYGGRGLIEDPTIYVLNKMIDVLKEIRVEVTRYNLYEEKSSLSILPKTLKEADGIILATNVEWFGIGGYMQQFLDACWLYADKDHLSKLYMMPIVLASTYGEREAELTLIKAWEILGGSTIDGLCAYVEDHVEFETNVTYGQMIERKAEQFYKAINQRTKVWPSSNTILRQILLKTNTIDLTPQESEQLSMYVSDDTYVKKQKEDIKELTQIFKEMLGVQENESPDAYIDRFYKNYHPIDDITASYAIILTDTMKTIIIQVNNKNLNCYYGTKEDADVTVKVSPEVLEKIMKGRMTFQRAFMSGDISSKGDFKVLRTIDQLFSFVS